MPSKTIDLTHLINEKMTVYPDTVGPKIEVLNWVEEHGFAELKIDMVLHTGTHIDAPCHILKDTKSLDQFPIEKFMGNAIVIPCQKEKEITVEFLKKFEEKIKQVDFVLFFTGWQFKWNTKHYFDDCPTPNAEAANWLANCKLKGIGFDAFSVDKIVSAHIVTPENLPNHYILLAKDFLLIENLTNLDKLPEGIFSFQCLPLNIEAADGSPVRAIAMIHE
ncbi:MAG: cyclase family protein [Bacteroidetes bacterium]|nr:cyclase family protein [Bacteroidota bacterium]